MKIEISLLDLSLLRERNEVGETEKEPILLRETWGKSKMDAS